MAICGIIAEYNPFHLGHQRQIIETRARLGADTTIVVVLSGNFVQRGEPAIFHKLARAEAAIACGADLVLELPLAWSLSSAEGFARGAVGLLWATGTVEYVSFGSECGALSELERTAAVLLRPELDSAIRGAMRTGVSYARARQAAAEALAGEALPALNRPNDLLAIEYLKAIHRFGAPMQALAIPRTDGSHDAMSPGAYPSGAYLRHLLEKGEAPADWIPVAAWSVFDRERRQGRGPVFPETLELALMSRLRALPAEAFAVLPDAGEGLENRLREAAAQGGDLWEIYRHAGTKRYTASRLRRMLWGAGLGLTREDHIGIPPYLRILAANGRGRAALRQFQNRSTLPLVTRPATARNLGAAAVRCLSLEAAAEDFYCLGFSTAVQRRGGAFFRGGPVIMDTSEYSGK